MAPSEPHLLLADLHSKLLRLISDTESKHFNGLAQAARHLRYRGISNRLTKKLTQLDTAYAYTRHITGTLAQQFFDDIEHELVDGQTDTPKLADNVVQAPQVQLDINEMKKMVHAALGPMHERLMANEQFMAEELKKNLFDLTAKLNEPTVNKPLEAEKYKNEDVQKDAIDEGLDAKSFKAMFEECVAKRIEEMGSGIAAAEDEAAPDRILEAEKYKNDVVQNKYKNEDVQKDADDELVAERFARGQEYGEGSVRRRGGA